MVPLVYCNGDSYCDQNYHESLVGNTFAEHVAKAINGYAINRAIKSSCNRRIIRTTVHDLVHQRQLNPTVKIVALISLSYEIRQEIWIEDRPDQLPAQETNLRTHKFSIQPNWRDNLLSGKNIQSNNTYNCYPKYFDMYSEGRAYFYSPYAERANLLCDLVMLKALMKSLNIDYLVFQGPRAETLEPEYLIDFFKQQLNDPGFFDLEEFGFVDWCYEHKFTPLDYHDQPTIAHYGADAHRAFAEQVLVPKLVDLYHYKL
jgi:hypothetical protein